MQLAPGNLAAFTLFVPQDKSLVGLKQDYFPRLVLFEASPVLSSLEISSTASDVPIATFSAEEAAQLPLSLHKRKKGPPSFCRPDDVCCCRISHAGRGLFQPETVAIVLDGRQFEPMQRHPSGSLHPETFGQVFCLIESVLFLSRHTFHFLEPEGFLGRKYRHGWASPFFRKLATGFLIPTVAQEGISKDSGHLESG